MPDFWQFPTGSMGHRRRSTRSIRRASCAISSIAASPTTSDRRVWGVFGDGEMDEPESTAALTLAAREKLDNLTFIVNCNLQRLDGPVRGNGQIIQELESLFTGAGWNVIKVLWGSDWDALFARDRRHALLRRFAETVDGEYQNLGAQRRRLQPRAFLRARSRTRARWSRHMTDAEIDALKRGGHDFRKLYAAFAAARAPQRAPDGDPRQDQEGLRHGRGRRVAHDRAPGQEARRRGAAARSATASRLPLERRGRRRARASTGRRPTVAEMRYLRARRAALGGFLPARRRRAPRRSPLPPLASLRGLCARRRRQGDVDHDGGRAHARRPAQGPGRSARASCRSSPTRRAPSAWRACSGRSASTRRRASSTSRRTPARCSSYREAKDGQLLEEGITEAGALSSWTAAATAYSVHGLPMLPFYIYYSMFGFQRVGDLIWAAADQRARGFLHRRHGGPHDARAARGCSTRTAPATSMAATVPNCRAYDPAFAYELAVILDHGAAPHDRSAGRRVLLPHRR